MTGKRIVYVVDDEEAIRRSLRLMLSVQGYSVTLFDSGASLLDALEGLVPGCLLLDVRMPGMDGLEVQRELAARGTMLPTVVMTGHGEFSVALTALRNGALAFLDKPFTKPAVMAALEAAFQKLEDPQGSRQHLAASSARLELLDRNERALLGGLVNGQSDRALAEQLAVDLSDIEMTRSRIRTKLKVDSLGEMLRIAITGGFGRNGA